MYNSQWFLFIETGLLLWALGVSMIGGVLSFWFLGGPSYLTRSRDAARMAHMLDAGSSLSSYYIDHEYYPKPTPGGCYPVANLLQERYIDSDQNYSDPPWIRLTSPGCNGDESSIAYRITTGTGTPGYYIATMMESPAYGNSAYSLDQYTQEQLNARNIVTQKGTGPHYIQYR